MPHERAPNALSAYVRTNVHMTQPTDTGIVDVGIRRDASNSQQLLSLNQRHEELAWPVECHALECHVIEKPSDEPEALGVGESGQFVEGGEVADVERAN
jgi:hypothetical protein